MYARAQAVIYQGSKYYILDGPVRGTQGSLYTISLVPPPIQGVREADLQPAVASNEGR